MRLTKHTDYALRVLMSLALRPEDNQTIGELAEKFQVSRNHLVKVVHNLATRGFVNSSRGRTGGLKLARPAITIRIGTVIEAFEPTMTVVQCESCPIESVCRLSKALDGGSKAFVKEMNTHTLEDLISNRRQLLRIVGPSG